MSDTRTPGQVAYEAWRQHWRAYPPHSRGAGEPGPWEFHAPLHQACWEAAAQAVLAMAQPEPEEERT
jgi:hypothetical protein